MRRSTLERLMDHLMIGHTYILMVDANDVMGSSRIIQDPPQEREVVLDEQVGDEE